MSKVLLLFLDIVIIISVRDYAIEIEFAHKFTNKKHLKFLQM